MNPILNGGILSLPLTAAVWPALRFLPRRTLGAAARYRTCWIAVIAAISFPIVYPPAHASPERLVNFAPALTTELPVFVPARSAP
jgi:hypothetical protein